MSTEQFLIGIILLSFFSKEIHLLAVGTLRSPAAPGWREQEGAQRSTAASPKAASRPGSCPLVVMPTVRTYHPFSPSVHHTASTWNVLLTHTFHFPNSKGRHVKTSLLENWFLLWSIMKCYVLTLVCMELSAWGISQWGVWNNRFSMSPLEPSIHLIPSSPQHYEVNINLSPSLPVSNTSGSPWGPNFFPPLHSAISFQICHCLLPLLHIHFGLGTSTSHLTRAIKTLVDTREAQKRPL